MPAPAAAPVLTLGQVATAHGIRGWVLVRSFADPQESLLDYEEWQLAAPNGVTRTVRLLEGAPYQQRLRVRFEGIEDRNAALALSGWQVQIARSKLPRLKKGEHYRDDLVGFEVRNVEGAVLGKVGYFADLPGGAVMVVKGGSAGEREHWVPTAPQHLLKVHAADRWISVDWPVEMP
jgi:16S rRNA processing protein RimM